MIFSTNKDACHVTGPGWPRAFDLQNKPFTDSNARGESNRVIYITMDTACVCVCVCVGVLATV